MSHRGGTLLLLYTITVRAAFVTLLTVVPPDVFWGHPRCVFVRFGLDKPGVLAISSVTHHSPTLCSPWILLRVLRVLRRAVLIFMRGGRWKTSIFLCDI